MAEPSPSLVARGRGVLLGGMVGDALGAPFEGESSGSVARICAHLGLEGPVDFVDARKFPDKVASATAVGLDLMAEPDQTGEYTDDTECLMALAESLIQVRGLNAEHVALNTALWFARPPDRGGYSAHTFEKLCALARGKVDHRSAGAMHNAWLRDHGGAAAAVDANKGSYGNGGAMRIAPLGFVYRHLANDVAAMRQLVADAVGFTHTHPEAVDAATIVALAVARCATSHESVLSGPITFMSGLHKACQTDGFQSRLAGCVAALTESQGDVKQDDDLPFFNEADKALLQSLCTAGKWFQIRAIDAVTYALFLVAKYGCLEKAGTVEGDAAAEEALVRTIAIGGDCDTLACIAGAVLGSAHGDRWIPERWSSAVVQDELTGWPRGSALGTDLAAVDMEQPLAQAGVAVLVEAVKSTLAELPLPVRHSQLA